MTGVVHMFYGIEAFDNHHFSLGVGFVPQLSNHERMMITSFKYRYQNPWQLQWQFRGDNYALSPLNFHVTGISGKDDDIYSKLPSHIPNGYYLPTSKRVLFGYQAHLSVNEDFELYADWSVLDVGLINYVRNFDFYRDNYRYGGLEGIISYGAGIRVKL